MSTDVNSSASESSSPAPVAPPSLDSLSKSDLQTWRLTGKLPESPSSDQSLAASTPAEPETQAASTDATQPPASEPGMPEKDGQPRKVKNADTRKEELNREIRDALSRRDAALREAEEAIRRRDAARQPESEPVKSAVTASNVRPDISKPPLTEDEFFALEGASLGQYSLYMGRYAAAEKHAEQERASRTSARDEAFAKRVKDEVDPTPEFLSQVPEKLWRAVRVEQLPANAPVTVLSVVKQEIYESDHPGLLMRHFADHPDELDALERLTSTPAIIRAIAKIESKFETSAAPVVQVKTQSSAPPPPTTLGRKPAVVADELEAAQRDRDFGRYRAEMNRRELAAAGLTR